MWRLWLDSCVLWVRLPTRVLTRPRTHHAHTHLPTHPPTHIHTHTCVPQVCFEFVTGKEPDPLALQRREKEEAARQARRVEGVEEEEEEERYAEANGVPEAVRAPLCCMHGETLTHFQSTYICRFP